MPEGVNQRGISLALDSVGEFRFRRRLTESLKYPASSPGVIQVEKVKTAILIRLLRMLIRL